MSALITVITFSPSRANFVPCTDEHTIIMSPEKECEGHCRDEENDEKYEQQEKV